MKRTDVAMIILIAAASAGIAYFIAHALFGTMSTQSIKVRTIDPITSVVQTPDKKIFNTNAINPSVEVNINNTDPTTSTGTTTNTTINAGTH
jgi:mannitol-specific phosphotransferase system IIBC component